MHGDAEVVQTLTSMPPRVHDDLVKKVRRLAIELQGYVKREKLSGQVLKNRTGTGRRSITYKVDESPDTVRGQVGTNVWYMGMHENGGMIAAHTRLITQAFGRELKFPVHVNVKAHMLPQRSFLRSSLKDNALHIKDELQKTVVKSVKGVRGA